MPLEDLVIYRKKIPESEPVFCEFPQSLHPEIQEFLKTSKYVTEFKDANQNEGGIGCTVATLK